MIGGHKVGGQGRWSRSRYRSWGQVGGGVKVWGPGRGVKVWGGVNVWGQGRGQGCGQGQGQGRGIKVRDMIGGHKVLGQGLGSMLGVKIRGVVKVMGRGSIGVRWSVGGGWR